jgi:RNA polymerase sigma-70 factor, ECF subfamily
VLTHVEASNAREEALDAMRVQLRAFIARRVESPEIADDLTQDVLLRIVISQHDQLENPTAWLYRLARNVIIDHYRARQSRARLASDPARGPDATDDPYAEAPEQAQRELATCLHSLVDQLAEPYRSAVTAVDLQSQTHAEAARAIGLSISGMKSRVQRGRIQLRQLLTDCCRVHLGATGGISSYEPTNGCKPDPSSQPRPRCGCA